MDPKELRGLVEAYQQIYAPQEEIGEAVKGESSERRKDLAAERRAGIKPLSSKEGEKYASHKMSQMAYVKRKRMGEEVEEVDEAVKGADPEMRRAASAERRAGDKRLAPSKGKGYAAHAMQQAAYIDKKTKGKYMPGMTHEEVEQVDEASYSAKAARAGKDIGKPGKAFAKIAASAGKRYGSKERGEKVAGAVLAKLRKEELDIFDVVLEYLVTEGYADDNQEALHIMANSSEEQILEYRKLAAAAVGGMMALNMMKPGMPAPKVKTPTPEREKTELVSKAKTGKEDKESKQYIQNRLERDRELGISK